MSECSNKILVIKGGVHFLSHCWKLAFLLKGDGILDNNGSGSLSDVSNNSSETDDSITEYIFKRSTAFSQSAKIPKASISFLE